MNAAVRPAANIDYAWASFVVRTILGFVYLYDGVHILTDAGVQAFARGMVESDGTRVLPGVMLAAIGFLTPLFDVLVGALLLLGLHTRRVLRVLAMLIIGVTASYGVHGLLHPTGATAMNVQVINLYILPRAALIMFLLFMPREDDRLSLDWLLASRRRVG